MEQLVQPTHLKNIGSGRMFLFTDILAQRSDMLPCDVDGKLVGNIIDADGTSQSIDRAKTKYLGSPVNGQLYAYTDILAQRTELVSVNSPEEWDAHRSKSVQIQAMKDAPPISAVQPVQADGQAVVLTRQEDSGSQVVPTNVTPPGSPHLYPTIPDISGLKSRDAKTLLANWAQETFRAKVSKQPKLEEVIDACQKLINDATPAPMPKAVGAN